MIAYAPSAEDEALENLEPEDSIEPDILALHEGLKTLTARQRWVVEVYYGLRGDNEPLTLREIASLAGWHYTTVFEHLRAALSRLERSMTPTNGAYR